MKTYFHVHVVKIVSEHEFDIAAADIDEARSKALKRPLTEKNKVQLRKPTKKMAITFD